ncbi:MAG: hypothetical protein Q4C42_06415 [Clostridia bacterium]|nr:hypothetical protein [Clostridia bacterium]
MITVLFNRRPVCAGDDIENSIYKIWLEDDSGLGELIDAVIFGGKGNTWPVPSSNNDWYVKSNIGELAVIKPNKSAVEYEAADESTPVSELDILWVYATWEKDECLDGIEGMFNRYGKYNYI